jgi:hypothetical protein
LGFILGRYREDFFGDRSSMKSESLDRGEMITVTLVGNLDDNLHFDGVCASYVGSQVVACVAQDVVFMIACESVFDSFCPFLPMNWTILS